MNDEIDVIVPCPRCGKHARYHQSNPSRPFCTERCRLIGLGAWANEEHRIAGEPVPDDDPDDLIH